MLPIEKLLESGAALCEREGPQIGINPQQIESDQNRIAATPIQ